ncbi:MAG TPA: GC-type dockerin domain-anchored protein, partial [Phycisphaerales bacterium]|nr:GC-type dockerin domain-anchored protein [Phycisphaerales bacterium]
RYSPSTGWVNAGSLARTVDPGTGRMVGGTTCDATINSPNDISADGRYIVGGAYSAVTTTSTGGVSAGLCGDFFAFRYDGLTGQFQALQTSSTTSRADRVNADGSVVTGYDLGLLPDPQGAYVGRRMVVWVNGAMTVLDNLGNQDSAPVNGPGTMVAAGASRAYCLANFGVNRTLLVRWVRSGSAWTAQNLGRPADREDEWGTILPFNALAARGISDDGGTIVGDAYYSGAQGQFTGTPRPFIWRASLNGGVPMDLLDYLSTIDPGGMALAGTRITAVRGLSADGNTLLVSGVDTRTTCTAPNQTLTAFFSGLLSLNASAVGAEPPVIAMHPVNSDTRCTWPGWGTVFNVLAGGSWPLSYQWQREDPANPGQWLTLDDACSGLPEMTFPHNTSWDYEGTRGPQLRVNVIAGDSSHDGRYRVIVSNAHGSVTSEPAALTFSGPINPAQPGDAAACPGSPAVFTVGEIPGGVEYRWELCTSPENDTWVILNDGVNTLSVGSPSALGTRTRTLTLDPGTLPAAQQWLLRCHIADSCNSLDTAPATLTIGSPCGPADMGAQGGVAAPCGDGVLDNNDFVVFIDRFFAGDPVADQGSQGGEPGADGEHNNNDFVVFIAHFFGGCN